MAKGFSLLKNLGLTEEVVIEKTEDPKIRPRNLGISDDIDAARREPTILVPVGAWRKTGGTIREPKDERIIGHQFNFTKSNTLSSFQSALCSFHEGVQTQKSNYKLHSLIKEADHLKIKIETLEEEKENLEEINSSRQQAILLLQKAMVQPIDYNSAFQCLKILANKPFLLPIRNDKPSKYKVSAKDPFEISHLAMTISESYSQELYAQGLFSFDTCPDWNKLKLWLMELQNEINGSKKIQGQDKLWNKFIKRFIFPKISLILDLDSSKLCAEWAMKWCVYGLFSQTNIEAFFIQIAKPFIISNLQELCDSFQIYSWIELSSNANLGSQFALIIRVYAEQKLKNWKPPNPLAIELVKKWPNALKNSLTFYHQVIAPKVSFSLELGNTDALLPWIGYFPDKLSATLISDSFLSPQKSLLVKLANKDLKSAAEMYVQIKNKIPMKFLEHPKIVQRLVEMLDILKQKISVLKGLKMDVNVSQATTEEFLNSIAAQNNTEFSQIGLIDGRTSYSIGEFIISEYGLVLYIRQNKNWVPIFVRDLIKMLQESV